MPFHHSILKTMAVVLMGMLAAACADKPSVTATSNVSTDPSTPGAPNMATVAAGTALPAGYKIDTDRTMIFGTDEKWTGRLSYATAASADEVFDFLHREMPNFGWVEASSMRSDISLFTFISTSTGRMATISITRGSALGGSTRVDMVVSPHGAEKR
jgi:hypothetical protein